MKLKTFTFYAVAAVSIALTSCNKLTSPKIDFNTGLISVNVKTVAVDTTKTSGVTNISMHTDSMDIQKTLDSSVSYADTKGFVVTQTAILDGTINNLVISNADVNDTRSFYDYFEYFDLQIKTNEAGEYLAIGSPINLMALDINTVSAAVTGNQFKTYLPTEIPAKGIKTPLFVKISSKPKRVIEVGQEFLLKVSVNSTIQVSKK